MLHKGGDKSQTLRFTRQWKKDKAFQAEGTAYAKAQRGESPWQVQVRDDETGVLGRAPGT